MPRLQQSSSTFSDISQAQAVLRLLRDELLPAYRQFHTDLLFHQTEAALFRPFFVGRACEALLQQGLRGTMRRGLCKQSIQRLNDYIGYRPVAALESRRHEPYPHEWVRPLPVYIEGAGVELGEYHEVVSTAHRDSPLDGAEHSPRGLFRPAALEELALDPRAYDFDHPVNKRPNYHFGQWDPHCIDNQGRYRRFIVQQVTAPGLDGPAGGSGRCAAGRIVVRSGRCAGRHHLDGVGH